MDDDHGSFLRTAFIAIAGCLIVHTGLDTVAAIGGPNAWEVAGMMSDSLVWSWNAVVGSPAIAAAAVPPIGAEGLVAPIENAASQICHNHGDFIHCIG